SYQKKLGAQLGVVPGAELLEATKVAAELNIPVSLCDREVRVTCRDWFQLSLKEGLTVFRDQEFSSDTNSRAIQRIRDVSFLRNHQFPEDAGPMAHPIRPESYIEINNFYTLTVYEKGAEVIRMLHTILGEKLFQEGMQLYIARHDGSAATTDEFIDAMEVALKKSSDPNRPSSLDLFRNWYSQAGTPTLTVSSRYDEKNQIYELSVKQSSGACGHKDINLHIPLSIGLISPEGCELAVCFEGETTQAASGSHTLHITQTDQSFRFEKIDHRPVPSLLRQFSAPIKLSYEYSDDELALLLLHDTDSFSKWEAGQRLYIKHLLSCVNQFAQGQTPLYDERLTKVFATILEPDFDKDKAFVAQMLLLPSEDYLAEQLDIVDIDAIHNAREFIRTNISIKLRDLLKQTYIDNRREEPYSYDPKHSGQRQLKNLCLNLLLASPNDDAEELCRSQFELADNMTDEISAFQTLVHSDSNLARLAIDSFFKKWHNEALVMDKWFAVQATAPNHATFARVQELLEHSHFNIKNPNKVRALIGSFAGGNPICFHHISGQGYRFLTDQILRLDQFNPNIASRLTGRLSHWRRYDTTRQDMLKNQLKRILAQAKVSKGVYEIASKSIEK
nr:DUF3458 domain-containing protein [Desulfobulbaceae bacterium]